MRPKKYDDRAELLIAQSLVGSVRGNMLLGKALAIAVSVIKSCDHPHKELSDAADMEAMAYLFEPFYAMEVASKRVWPKGGQPQ